MRALRQGPVSSTPLQNLKTSPCLVVEVASRWSSAVMAHKTWSTEHVRGTVAPWQKGVCLRDRDCELVSLLGPVYVAVMQGQEFTVLQESEECNQHCDPKDGVVIGRGEKEGVKDPE